MEGSEEDKVEYIPYSALAAPNTGTNLEDYVKSINHKFQSKEWKQHFEALSKQIIIPAELRSLNKFCPQIYIKTILPQTLREAVSQVDNLRSNNSKQALTLISETIKYNQLKVLTDEQLSIVVSKIFNKSCSEKGFIRNQALESVTSFETAEHPKLCIELMRQTQLPNYQIAELGILTLKNHLSKRKAEKEVLMNEEFLRLLVRSLNGKRVVIEKTGREILSLLDQSFSTEGITTLIGNTNLSKEDHDALIAEITKLKTAPTKQAKGSLKDFLKQKQKSNLQDKASEKMQTE